MPQTLRIDLDRSSPVPLYYQVAHVLEQAIESGALPAGTRLDNEIALAEQLGLSRPTMRRAIEYLVDRGLLVRKRGVGTQVVKPPVRRPVELTSLHDDLTKSGRKPSTEVLEHRTVSASAEVAEALELPEGTEVVMIRRLRMADGEPLAVLTNYVPLDIAPTVEELATSGLYDLLRSRGAKPKVARQRIGARSATAAEARTLGEKPRAALLTMERTAYDDNGKGIEFGQHIYRASRYMFDTMLFAS